MSLRAGKPAALAAALLLCGCTMSTEWWIDHSLKRAGFDGGEAKCATRGIMTHLTGEQLFAIREALLVGERPPRFADVQDLLAFLETRMPADVQAVLVHYAAHCRRAA